MVEKQKELEERIVVKSSANYVSKEDIKKNVTEEIETRLQEKVTEEKAGKDRRNNIIAFGIKENQATDKKDKQTEDMKEIKKILNESCEVQLNEDVAKVICMGKCTESKKRPIIITIKTKEKKKETFQNLQKLRRSIENITITHDLPKK